jgi:hypothetical protein
MTALPDGFGRFLLSSAEAPAMRARFLPVLTNTDLAKGERVNEVMQNYRTAVGLYFWLMRYGGAEYKIYIGKTKSFSYRILNYISDFQPHSPNDYKLRIFHAFVAEVLPGSELDLYFAREALESLTAAETLAVSQYGPLLNKLPLPSAAAREELRKAFSLYYRSSLEQCLRNDA